MIQLADKVFVETTYPGVNVGAVVTRKGTVCIDTPSFPRDARHWATRLHQLQPQALLFLLLTDYHGDRILNTRWFNAPIVAQSFTEQRLNSYEKRYPQTLLDSLVARNPECGRELLNSPVEQPALSFMHDMTIGSGRRRMVLLHRPGPTRGTVWVHLPELGILFTSDSVVVDEHPLLAQADTEQWLDSLAQLQTDERFAGVQTIVPGRGSICDKSAIEPVVRYIQDMRALVHDHWQQQLPREALSRHVAKFMSYFPASPWPREWVARQTRLGLEHLYDEIKWKQPAHIL